MLEPTPAPWCMRVSRTPFGGVLSAKKENRPRIVRQLLATLPSAVECLYVGQSEPADAGFEMGPPFIVPGAR